MPWIVAITQPIFGGPPRALPFLRDNGFTTYWPRYRETLIVKGKRTNRILGLCPRYVFVDTPDFNLWPFVRRTLHVVRLIMEGLQPRRVPDKVIHALQSREDSEGLVVLPPPPAKFEIGQWVSCVKTALAWKVGTVSGFPDTGLVDVHYDMLGGVTLALRELDLVAV